MDVRPALAWRRCLQWGNKVVGCCAECRHDVQAVPLRDPVSGHSAMLLLQSDISERAELEARMAALTEAQLQMLEQMFPR